MDKGNSDIEKLLTGLKSQVEKIEDQMQRENALLRLQSAMQAYAGEDEVVSSEFISEEIKKRPKTPGMMTGIKGLDEILQGFMKKQVIVLAGITKHGKTNFSVFLTGKMRHCNPLWLPFEESAEEIIMKFHDRGQEPPLFYTPRTVKERTLQWIESRIVESKVKYGTELVFIDHLGFIVPHSQNEAVEIGRTMRAIKDLAKKWDVAILLMAHLTKTQIDRHPNLEDLRGSAAIGQEADTVMFIWRETNKGKKGEIEITNKTNLSVQANRRLGTTGNVKMVYTNGNYYEEDWQHTPPGYADLSEQANREWYGDDDEYDRKS